MLQHNPDVNVQSNDRETSIIVVPKKGYIEIFIATQKEFIRHRADLTAVDEKGRTALRLATINRKSNFVEVLLKGASLDLINRRDHRWGLTLLMRAVRNGDLSILQLLLNHQADPTLTDNKGETAMNQAMRIAMSRVGYSRSMKKVLEVLLSHPSVDTDTLDQHGRTPLCSAVEMENTNLVKLLLRNEVNVDVAAKSGQTPLIIAIIKNYIGIIELLLEHQADTERRDCEGRTPLIIATESNRVEIVRLLLKYKANLKATDCDGRTPLMIAKSGNQNELIRILAKSAVC